MRLFVALVTVVSLSVLTGCAQTRCAGQAVSRAGRSVGRTATNVWTNVSCAVDRATDCGNQCEPPTVVTCPVYDGGCCGGDQGVGRTGTGAFAIPPGP